VDCVKTKEKRFIKKSFFFFILFCSNLIQENDPNGTERREERRDFSILCSFPGTPGPFVPISILVTLIKKSPGRSFSHENVFGSVSRFGVFFFFLCFTKKRG
jgi:hypothetical protein